MKEYTVNDCFYHIQNGANIKQGEVGGGYPITRIETISNDIFNRDRVGYAGITELGKYEAYVLEDEDLLMSHINSLQYLGRTVLYRKWQDEIIIHGMNLLRLKANRNIICPAYAKYYFHSFRFREQIRKITKKSVNQASFAVNDLKKIHIYLPELKEQQEVVAVFDKVQAIINMRKNELEELNNLIKSRFVEMFGDPLLNTKGYPIKLLPEIAEYWNGLTYKPEDVSDEGTIVLRSSNIQNAQLNFQDTVRVSCKIGDKKYVKDNDILMCSRNGSARLVGKVALIQNVSEPMSFGAFMMIIRSEYCQYLMIYFQMPAFRAQITTGATTTINQITGRMLDVVKLPIPDMREISEFSDFCKQVDKLKFISTNYRIKYIYNEEVSA